MAAAVLKAGSLEKSKGDEWKHRYCEVEQEPGGAGLANSFESENLRHVDECESDAECDADCESEAARPSDLRAGAVEGRSSSEPARSSSSSPSVRRRALERQAKEMQVGRYYISAAEQRQLRQQLRTIRQEARELQHEADMVRSIDLQGAKRRTLDTLQAEAASTSRAERAQETVRELQKSLEQQREELKKAKADAAAERANVRQAEGAAGSAAASH